MKFVNYWILPGLKNRAKTNDLPLPKYYLMPAEIIKVCCDYYGLTVDEIKAKRRTDILVKARRACYYFMKKYTSLSLKDIGKHFLGNLIIHNCFAQFSNT